MDASAPSQFVSHRPGAVSTFFVYKAGVFAAGFWGWLAVLVVRGDPISGWHMVATAGAITTTLVGLVLGARHALQRDAAARHEQVMRTLVEMSWYEFAQAAKGGDADADVITLPQESRPRPRR